MVRFGIKGNFGGLRSAKVRAALYFAKQKRLAKILPYVSTAYVTADYVAIVKPVDARYVSVDYVIQGYVA